MTEERDEELASLYVFGLCEGEERERFEADLGRKPVLHALVREMREAATALTHLAPAVPPPPELKLRLLATVTSADRAAAPSPPWSATVVPFLPWAAAAACLLGTAWFSLLYLSSRSEAGLLRDRAALDAIALQSARQQLEAERILARQQLAGLERPIQAASAQLDLAHLRIVALSSPRPESPQAVAVAVWDAARQEGILQVEKMPNLLPTQDYQLWVVDPQYPNPVDGGVFSVSADRGTARVTFKARQPVANASAFAVTVERKGGVSKAEGPFVLLGR